MVNSRICLCHGTVGWTKLTRKNKADIKRNRDTRQRELPRRVKILVVPEAICIVAFFCGLIIHIHIYLSLEQHRLELHVPTYMWISFSQ